ncbi:hypothetical protein GCM10011613_27130 [Cellvibrio zantedeschiae]|uniref:DUF2288 domain-containing protein n=1 Tax=Cellvibrio zantedeschiae TaxID=1237077 RepID=A0ABQ3B6N0_9GAMM|nr:DUF2288 domain-containing protein [Cellvibrio zantedeschiae]GGY80656.1 hypothetical protein GCM10011613_27130 [Cellvibrio zantedeschiae]
MNEKDLASELVLETAQIHWHELQRFFASGNAIAVDESLDLIYVATQITQDNATQVKEWMEAGLVDAVKDSQAQEWYDQNATVWALVIKPWVLVQYKKLPPK